MLELKNYIKKVKLEIGGMISDNDIKKEWQNELFDHLKQGGKITKTMLDELDGGQKFYINKHYTIHGINIIQ